MKAIVLTFDRLALRLLGCSGNAWIDTPHFDLLAAEGVVFDRCFGEWFGTRNAESPDDAGHAWFTGAAHGAQVGDESQALPALGEILKRAGIEARLIVEEGAENPRWESAGFEDVRIVSGRDGLDVPDDETPFAQLVAAGAACLDDWAEEGVENGLLWLKSCGVPRPWTPPREFAAEYVGLFEDEADDDLDEPPDDELDDEPGERADDELDADDIDAEEKDGDEGDDEEAADDFEVDDDADDADDAEFAADLEEEAAEFDQLLDALGRAGEGDPARLTPGDWKLARAVYAGYVSMLDVWFGELREVVAELGEEVLWIITAAEGEALGERVGLVVPSSHSGEKVRVRGQSREAASTPDDMPPLAEERIHLPLIVHLPGGEGGARRQDLVQTADLAPTLCEFFGIDRAEPHLEGHSEGHSLLPSIVRNEPVPRDALFLADDDFRAIRTPDYFLIRSTRFNADDHSLAVSRLYLQPDDPWAIHDVAAQSPAVVEDLEARLDEFFGG